MATVAKTATERPHADEPRNLAAEGVPLLENGDRLTRAEFERRYDAMPDLKKAELIEGIVHIPPAIRFEHHSAPRFDLIGRLAAYRAATPGVRGGDNGSIRLDMDNMPQPDAFLLILPACGGQARIDDEDYVAGGPELVAEVSSSSVSIDLHAKFNVYRRNNVREYVVWRILDSAIDWYVLREGRYEALALSPDGRYQSEAFPGLWLPPQALIRGDLVAVLDVARQGIASPDHAAFVARLRGQAKPEA